MSGVPSMPEDADKLPEAKTITPPGKARWLLSNVHRYADADLSAAALVGRAMGQGIYPPEDVDRETWFEAAREVAGPCA